MNIEISTKHITVNEVMKQDIVKKMEHLSRFDHHAADRLNVEIIKITGEHHRKGEIFEVVAKLRSGKKLIIQADGVGESVLGACEKAKKEMERQFMKIKEKKQEDKRGTRREVMKMRGKE